MTPFSNNHLGGILTMAHVETPLVSAGSAEAKEVQGSTYSRWYRLVQTLMLPIRISPEAFGTLYLGMYWVSSSS